MEIKINISKKTAKHFIPYHTFYDSCGQVEEVMKKVQKEIKKQLNLNNER